MEIEKDVCFHIQQGVGMKRIEFYKCKFCADYHFLKSFCNNKAIDNNVHDRWCVSLIQEVKEVHDIKATKNFGNYALKFCPVCGEKL